jgi:uroporphyrinogen-III synthase
VITFDGLRVLSLESRRATEVATLIATLGGRPLIAPALREIPLASNTAALKFIRHQIADPFEMVIFLTGVGARALVDMADQERLREAFVEALSRSKVVVRGPKSLTVMRELKVPVWATAPEPNTWRDVILAIREQSRGERFERVRIAVQEYGQSNLELLDALRSRGADVTPVPVYRWALPDDVQPLKDAAAAIARGEVDVALFMTSMQIVHLWQIVTELALEDDVRRQLHRTVIASIGPLTSDELRRYGLTVDLEASHPKLGVLVKEAAAHAAGLLRTKRGG